MDVAEYNSVQRNVRVVTICMPEAFCEGIDKLIKQGTYPNRSEAIRIAIRDLLVDELWGQRRHGKVVPLVTQLEQLSEVDNLETTPPPS